MEAHVDKLQDTIKDRLSACRVILVLDNSSNHTKCSDDAVLSRRMTVNPGAVVRGCKCVSGMQAMALQCDLWQCCCTGGTNNCKTSKTTYHHHYKMGSFNSEPYDFMEANPDAGKPAGKGEFCDQPQTRFKGT